MGRIWRHKKVDRSTTTEEAAKKDNNNNNNGQVDDHEAAESSTLRCSQNDLATFLFLSFYLLVKLGHNDGLFLRSRSTRRGGSSVKPSPSAHVSCAAAVAGGFPASILLFPQFSSFQ